MESEISKTEQPEKPLLPIPKIVIKWGSHWVIYPILMVVAFLDFFILLIPSDAFLLGAMIASPKKVKWHVACMVTGRIVAAVCILLLSHHVDIQWVQAKVSAYNFDSMWTRAHGFCEKYGPFAVGISVFTPVSPIFPTVLSIFSKASFLAIALSLAFGSIVRYILLCVAVWGGAKLYQKNAKAKKN